jgi:hypothetical protein
VDLVHDLGGGDLPPLTTGVAKQNLLAGSPALVGSSATALTSTALPIREFNAFERAGKVVFEVVFDSGDREELLEFVPNSRVTYPWRVRGSLNASFVAPEAGQSATVYSVGTTRYAEFPCLLTGTVHLP